MKKLFAGIVSNILMMLLPLVFNYRLMLHYKIIVIVLAGLCIWLTQPMATVKDTKDKQSSDQFTVLLIFIMSFISVSVPITIWAYFKDNQDDFGVMSIVGIIVIVTGLILRAWSVKTLGKYFTPTIQIQRNHELIMTGPYAFLRHPSYTGAFMVISGCAIWLQTWEGFLIACIAMSIAYKRRISLEEAALGEHFGLKYRLYKDKTSMLIPFIW